MYISVHDASKKFKISTRRVQILCEQGRIEGAVMENGVWFIPKNSKKPLDGRTKSAKKLISTNALTVDDVCKKLSISRATARNWIRLGKITPDMGDQLFSKEYIDQFSIQIKSHDNLNLKSRRNKKSITGNILYRDYISTMKNQQLVAELIELDIVHSERDLLILLANFAIQLYYERQGVNFSDGNVLMDFLTKKHNDDFYLLVNDLLFKETIDSSVLERLQPALSKKIHFVYGEDSLGFVYISLQDIGKRKSNGAYYTPDKIVNELIDRLFENDSNLFDKTIFDPCCGTGNFLLKLISKGVDVRHLYGEELDFISAYLARINVALMVPSVPTELIVSRIMVGNTYFETFFQKFDVILGNPPWGSDISNEDKLRCQKIFQTAVGKNLEAYDLFIEKGITMLKPNGVLAFVLPEAILNVASHRFIRNLILDTCSFSFLSYLGNVFSDVQCPSIILGIKKEEVPTMIGCNVMDGKKKYVISTPRNFDDGMISLYLTDEENACLNFISQSKNKIYLKNHAKFALGIVTGNNKKYISNQKNSTNEVILKGSDIFKYSIVLPQNYISFTPPLFQQVAPTDMYRAKEKLLYRFISEVPVFAYDNQQLLSLNSCNILIPEIPELSMKYILAILNSSVTAFFVLKKFRSVKLLRSHIEQIPIPMAPKNIQASIVQKVDQIMNSGNTKELYDELDHEIMKLFGLSNAQIKIIQSTLKEKNLFLK